MEANLKKQQEELAQATHNNGTSKWFDYRNDPIIIFMIGE
jgi:hypothetical protein